MRIYSGFCKKHECPWENDEADVCCMCQLEREAAAWREVVEATKRSLSYDGLGREVSRVVRKYDKESGNDKR